MNKLEIWCDYIKSCFDELAKIVFIEIYHKRSLSGFLHIDKEEPLKFETSCKEYGEDSFICTIVKEGVNLC